MGVLETMRAWEKGAMAGGLWGLLNNFISIYLAFTTEDYWMIFSEMNIVFKILYLPSLITGRLLTDFLIDKPPPDQGLLSLFFLVILFFGTVILIGSFIGAVLGLGIEKYRQRSVK